MSRRKPTIIIAMLALAVALVWALSKDGTKPAAAIRFAYQDRIGDAACIIAIEQGYFVEEGVQIESFRFNSGPACAEALYSGSADVGTMGDTTAIIAISRDRRLRIFASHGQGEHRHRLVARPNLQASTIGELKGKTMAVKKGTSTYGGFMAFLASKRIDPASIRIIDMQPSEMPDALAAGSIDAFVASEPTPSLAELRGAQELTTMGGLGNSYPVLMLAKDKFLKERSEDVLRLLKAIQRGEDFVKQHPDKAARILSQATGLSPKVARQAMARHCFELCLDGTTLRSLEKTASFLKQWGTIEAIPDLDHAVNDRFVAYVVEPDN